MALSLLDRVKNKALEALQGVGNFVTQDFQRSPLGQGIDAVSQVFNPQPQPQQRVAPPPPPEIDFGKVIGDFLDSQMKAPAIPQLGKFSPSTKDVLSTAADFTYRPIARAGAEAVMTLQDDNSEVDTGTGFKNPTIAKILYGDDKLRAFDNPNRPGAKFAEKVGNKNLAPLFIGAGLAIDAVPLNPAKLLTKGGIKTTAKFAKTFEEFAEILGKNKKLAQEAYAIFKDAKNPIENVEQLYAKYGPQAAKKTVELFKGTGEAVEKVVDNAGNPFKTSDLLKAKEFGEKPNKYMQIVGEAPRNFKKYFGAQWDNVKANYFDPLDYSKAHAVDFKNTYNKAISDLNIKAGTRLSAAVHQFGEGKKSIEQITKEFGEKGAARIVEADKTFRNTYSSILDEVNTLRKEAGLPEIPKRKDYYRHMNEEGKSFFDSLVNGGARGEVSTSIGKKRTGDLTKFDAVKGFSDYIERAAHAGFIEPHAVQFEKLAAELSKNPNVPSDLVKELGDYAKTQIRGVRDPFSNSEFANTVVGGINKVGGIVRANRIIGNVSSILAQSLNLPLAISDAGVGATLKGIFNFPKNLKLVNESPFIKDRLYSQPLKFSTGLTKLKGYGGKALQEADGAASRLITSMYYEKALSMGLKGEKALKWAGDEARLTIGGRGVGDFSKFQTSSAGQFIAPFTLEVQSGLNRLGQKVADRHIKAVVGYFIMTTGINDAYEKLTGYRPLPDPIETALDMYRSASGTDGKDQSWLKVAGRAIAGATEFMPIAQNAMAFGYPIVSEFLKDENGDSYLPDFREIFGSDDPTRFGSAKMYLPSDSVVTGNRPLDLGLNAVLGYSPTGYGGQVKKTLSGLIAEGKGYTESKSGKVLHPLDQDIPTAIQTAIFGPWSTDKSREFFNNENSRGLTQKQSDVYKESDPEYRDTIFSNAQKTASKFFGGDGGKNKSGDVGDSIIWTNENGYDETINLTATDNSDKEGIAKYKVGTTNASKAVKLWGAPNDQVPDDVKEKAYAKLGFKVDDVRYAYKAGFTNDEKTAYIVDQNLEHGKLLEQLTTGRVESIKGDYFAANGVLDNLYEQGLLSDAERDYLKKIKIGKDGKIATSTLAAGKKSGLTPAKIKAYINSINSLHKDPLVPKSQKSTTPKKVATPKFASVAKTAGNGGKTKNQWFNTY